MQAIEFQTHLDHGTIRLPDSLRLANGRQVRVLLLLDESVEPQAKTRDAIDDLLENPLILAGFEPMSREQAHER